MQPAYKIEMYDSGVVLFHTPEDAKYEFTGWDYSESTHGYEITSFGLELLTSMNLIDGPTLTELENRDTRRLVEKPMFRRVYCNSLEAEELPNGNLKILAQAIYNHEDIGTKDTEGWYVSATYKGQYTVFWEE